MSDNPVSFRQLSSELNWPEPEALHWGPQTLLAHLQDGHGVWPASPDMAKGVAELTRLHWMAHERDGVA